MELTQFFSNYPDITDNSFYKTIATKKEFVDLKLSKVKSTDKKKQTTFLNQQIFTSRFLSPHTLYRSLLLFHSMGTGKSRSAILTIEEAIDSRLFKRGIIFSSSGTISKNFQDEILKTFPHKYYKRSRTTGGGDVLDRDPALVNISLKYEFTTFSTFIKKVKELPKEKRIEYYSNCVLVFDEVHNMVSKTLGNDIYEDYHTFLHDLENVKILLLTGSPMLNEVHESAKLLNLILPMDNQLEIKNFETTYLGSSDKNKMFKNIIKGYVSYLREEIDPNITIIEEGKINEPLTKMKTTDVTMSQEQTEGYDKAYKEDKNKTKADESGSDDDLKEKSSFFPNSQQASLFSWNNKYGVEIESEVKKIKTEISKGNTIKDKLSILKIYSSKYADIIRKIIDSPPGISFVFCRFVRGSGLILFGELLRIFNITFLNLSTSTNIQKDIDTLNKPGNKFGDVYKVVLGSQLISEGYTFKNIVNIFIVSPFFNYSRVEQAIYRGIRFLSQADLIKAQGKVTVSIYKYINIPNSKTVSVDLRMYEISEDKDKKIQAVKRLMMESSVDCHLYYDRNKGMVDNSRECQYMKCDYTCDGIKAASIQKTEIDYNTYDLFFLGKPHPLIYKLETIYKQSGVKPADIETDYKLSNDEIELLPIIDTVKSIFDTMVIKIQELFKTHFQMKYESIQVILQFTNYELLSVLDYIISHHIKIINKYGFTCFLREHNDMYYLVNSNYDNITSSYYVEYIATNQIISQVDVKINTIFDSKRFDLLLTLDDVTQNKLLLYCLENKNIKYRKDILNVFDSFYMMSKDNKTIYVHKLLPVIFDVNTGTWSSTWSKSMSPITLTDDNTYIFIMYLMYLIDTKLTTIKYASYITVFDKSNIVIMVKNVFRYLVNGKWTLYDTDLEKKYIKQVHDKTFVNDGQYYGTYNELDVDDDPVKFCIVENLAKDAIESKDTRKRKTGSVCNKSNITDKLLRELDIDIVDVKTKKKKPIHKICNEIFNQMKEKNRVKIDKTCGSSFKKKKIDDVKDVFDDKTDVNIGYFGIPDNKKDEVKNYNKDKYIFYNFSQLNKYKGSIVLDKKGVIHFSNIRKSNANIMIVGINKIKLDFKLTQLHTVDIPDSDTSYYILLKRANFKQPTKDLQYMVVS